MRKYPQLELLQICRTNAIGILGEGNVYESIPFREVAYPFFVIGEQQTVENGNKDVIFPNIFQTIHYYGYLEKRGSAITQCGKLMDSIRIVSQTEDYRINITKIDFRLLEDRTTATPLIHCIIDVSAVFY